MPGCGKSSIGVVLAKVLGYNFVDSDLLIQAKEKRRLSEILDEEGPERFNAIEEEVNASIEVTRTVIATGGSVVYGAKAMKHLGEIAELVYLQLPFEEVEERLGDLRKRGVSLRPGQRLRDLYLERTPLYEKYADVTADLAGLDIRQAVFKITGALNCRE